MFRNIVTKFKTFNLLINQYEYICIALYLVHKNTKNSLSRNQVTAVIIQRHMYIESQFTVSFFGFFFTLHSNNTNIPKSNQTKC